VDASGSTEEVDDPGAERSSLSIVEGFERKRWIHRRCVAHPSIIASPAKARFASQATPIQVVRVAIVTSFTALPDAVAARTHLHGAIGRAVVSPLVGRGIAYLCAHEDPVVANGATINSVDAAIASLDRTSSIAAIIAEFIAVVTALEVFHEPISTNGRGTAVPQGHRRWSAIAAAAASKEGDRCPERCQSNGVVLHKVHSLARRFAPQTSWPRALSS